MRLCSLYVSNFQSFGPAMEEISFEDVTYLLGPNGAGKTAALQALCRMFSFDPSLRRIRRSDFPFLPQKLSNQSSVIFGWKRISRSRKHSTMMITTPCRRSSGKWLCAKQESPREYAFA